METKQAKRIQTSFLNGVERKALIWMAERMPSWVTSDLLSFIGFLGAVMIMAGYAHTGIDPAFLWLASAGFVVNWFGDSLDGTLARVRNQQRPIYGYYIDHTLDCINEMIIFIGLGFSHLVDMRIALLIYIAYLLMTINVSVNAHLKGEFKLTYAKLGPTEFRLIAIVFNTVLIFSDALRNFTFDITFLGRSTVLRGLDVAGLAVTAIILLMYLVTVIKDASGYARIDPKKR